MTTGTTEITTTKGTRRFDEVHKAAHRVMNKFSDFGATDSEPRWFYSSLILRAFEGEEVTVPSKADSWQLYSKRGNGLAAVALKKATENVIAVVAELGPRDAKLIRDYYGDEFDM